MDLNSSRESGSRFCTGDWVFATAADPASLVTLFWQVFCKCPSSPQFLQVGRLRSFFAGAAVAGLGLFEHHFAWRFGFLHSGQRSPDFSFTFGFREFSAVAFLAGSPDRRSITSSAVSSVSILLYTRPWPLSMETTLKYFIHSNVPPPRPCVQCGHLCITWRFFPFRGVNFRGRYRVPLHNWRVSSARVRFWCAMRPPTRAEESKKVAVLSGHWLHCSLSFRCLEITDMGRE